MYTLPRLAVNEISSEETAISRNISWTSNAADGPILKMYGDANAITATTGSSMTMTRPMPRTDVVKTRLAPSISPLWTAITM